MEVSKEAGSQECCALWSQHDWKEVRDVQEGGGIHWEVIAGLYPRIPKDQGQPRAYPRRTRQERKKGVTALSARLPFCSLTVSSTRNTVASTGCERNENLESKRKHWFGGAVMWSQSLGSFELKLVRWSLGDILEVRYGCCGSDCMRTGKRTKQVTREYKRKE